MIKLVSTFLNSEGKKHSLTVKDPDTSLSAEATKEALVLLSSLNIFEKDGVALFEQVVSAKYVETIETPIFKGDKLFGVPTPEETPEVNEENKKEELALRCTWQETPKVPEVIETNSLEQLKAQSSWRPMPQVPTVNLSSLESAKEVHIDNETPNSNQAVELESIIEEETSDPPEKPYNLVKEMFKRRIRRKEKEERRRQRDSSDSS